MFFIIWGWAQRVRTDGVVGPFTCASCGWVGTFWVRTVERRFKLYFVQIGRWRSRGTATVCRNCGKGFTVPPTDVPALMATVQPIVTRDPVQVVAPDDQPPDCQHCGAPVDGRADRCGACGKRLQPLRAG